MIRYLKYEEIDKHKWDQCISKSFNGIIYAYSWYLDIVCPAWEALVENDYEKVFPLTARKKSGINYLFQPFFTQQLGLFSISEIGLKEIDVFLKQLPRKYKFVEINLNTYNKPDSTKFHLLPNLTYELDLRTSYETIFHHYSENTKRNIKLATKSDVYIENISDPNQIINLFRENKGREIATLKENDYLSLQKLIVASLSINYAFLKAAYNINDEMIAGAVFFKSHSRLIFIFSGANDEAKATGAMSYIIDSVIKEYALSDRALDFEGSNNTDLARFYKSFGAEECVYYLYTKNELHWMLSKIITFIKSIR